ncbi:MAG: hypothetical protein ACO24E_06860 [Vulcanococcus sp.]
MPSLSEEEFHQYMSTEYRRQLKAAPEATPDGIDPQVWKNRHLVSSKLPAGIYADLMRFCRQHQMSVNTALKTILQEKFNSSDV